MQSRFPRLWKLLEDIVSLSLPEKRDLAKCSVNAGTLIRHEQFPCFLLLHFLDDISVVDLVIFTGKHCSFKF